MKRASTEGEAMKLTGIEISTVETGFFRDNVVGTLMGTRKSRDFPIALHSLSREVQGRHGHTN